LKWWVKIYTYGDLWSLFPCDAAFFHSLIHVYAPSVFFFRLNYVYLVFIKMYPSSPVGCRTRRVSFTLKEHHKYLVLMNFVCVFFSSLSNTPHRLLCKVEGDCIRSLLCDYTITYFCNSFAWLIFNACVLFWQFICRITLRLGNTQILVYGGKQINGCCESLSVSGVSIHSRFSVCAYFCFSFFSDAKVQK